MSTPTHPETAEAHSETTEETFVSDDVIRHHESIRNTISVIEAFLLFLISSMAIVHLIYP